VENNLIKLRLLGVTFSQVQAGAYALILTEDNGPRRVPIIVGTPEAQSIAIFLEGLTPPRPLTHDLFVNLTKALFIKLKAAYIYKYEEGIFFSSLVYEQFDGSEVVVDSRTSDAIAIAIRCDAPIYITESIMQTVSVSIDESNDLFEEIEKGQPVAVNEPTPSSSFDNMSLDELNAALDNAVNAEDYEKASQIRDAINKLK